jgi:hypothetical protein
MSGADEGHEEWKKSGSAGNGAKIRDLIAPEEAAEDSAKVRLMQMGLKGRSNVICMAKAQP